MNNSSLDSKNKNTPFLTRHEDMLKITYENSHKNNTLPDDSDRQGKALNHCTWLIEERNSSNEKQLPVSNISGLVESYLEPFASIGWHTHTDTEETYYILEGSLTVEYEDNNKNQYKDTLLKGDLHRVLKGMSHCAKTGKDGCRFIAFIVR